MPCGVILGHFGVILGPFLCHPGPSWARGDFGLRGPPPADPKMGTQTSPKVIQKVMSIPKRTSIGQTAKIIRKNIEQTSKKYPNRAQFGDLFASKIAMKVKNVDLHESEFGLRNK